MRHGILIPPLFGGRCSQGAESRGLLASPPGQWIEPARSPRSLLLLRAGGAQCPKGYSLLVGQYVAVTKLKLAPGLRALDTCLPSIRANRCSIGPRPACRLAGL